MCGVIGDQKGHAGRDGVVTGIKGSRICQDDPLGGSGRSSGICLVQIKIIGASHKEHRAALGNKLWLDGDVFLDVEGRRVVGAEILAVGHIVPAVKVIAAVRRRVHYEGNGRALGPGNGGSHRGSVQRERTVLAGLEGDRGVDRLDLQGNVRERHRDAGADAVVVVGAGDNNRCRSPCGQLNGFGAAGAADRRTSDLQRAVIGIRRPVEGQVRGRTEVVGQRQRSRYGRVAAAALGCFHVSLDGIPAGHGPRSVFIRSGKAVHSQSGQLRRPGDVGYKRRQHQDHHQQGQGALHHVFKHIATSFLMIGHGRYAPCDAF